MEWILIIFIVVGYLLYKSFSSGDSKSSADNGQYQRRRTGRAGNYTEDRTRQSLITSAKRQEDMGNFDAASRLYLRAGQVFSAAKMKAQKGPQHANSAVELIQVNAPDKTEMITRNLANEFYYRREEPATAAALLRGLGLTEEAEAVEVASGISPVQTNVQSSSTASETTSTQASSEQQVSETYSEIDEVSQDEVIETETDNTSVLSELDEITSDYETTEEEEPVETPPPDKSYPNTMMMASNTLEKSCSACKRPIKSGDSFIYCLHCGHPGHWSHLGEMIKVTGKCPVCKARLAQSMYDV